MRVNKAPQVVLPDDYDENAGVVWEVVKTDEAWMHEKRQDGTYTYCRAKRRKKGEDGEIVYCKGRSVVGSNRCRLHGGASPRGIAHQGFQHGRYSKALPKQHLRDYDRERLDENITSLTDEIGLLRVRVQELLRLADVGNTADAWIGAREAVKAMIRAREVGDELEFLKAFDKLKEYMTEPTDYAYWKELNLHLELLRKLSDTEQRRLVAMQNLMTVNEYITVLTAIARVIRDKMKDQNEAKEVIGAIQKLID